jgi:hypothetical protein
MKLLKGISLSDVVLIVSFFSILNNGFLDLGVRLYIILPFIYLLLTNNFKLSAFNNSLGYELIYFAFIFIIISIIIPFPDPLSNVRSITQRFNGRFFTQFIRFILEVGVARFYLIIYKRNNLKFCNYLFNVTLFSIIIGLVDFFIFNGFIYSLFLGETHVSGRFTGLNVEPRMFGIILVYVYCFLSINKFSNKKLLPIFIAIILTNSVSSIIILFIIFIYFNRRNKFLILVLSIIVLNFFSFYLLPNIDQFKLIFNRLDYLINIKSDFDFHPLFSVFEVFDRAALNALFYNKIYLITGFGPNTISIPSSYYIPEEFESIYQGLINSVPHSGFVNILSRSGIIVLILFCLRFFRSKNYIFFIVYLIQANFIFYTFYSILFNNGSNKK